MTRWAELALEPRISCRSVAKKMFGTVAGRVSCVNFYACKCTVVALLGTAKGFMAYVWCIPSHAGETPSVGRGACCSAVVPPGAAAAPTAVYIHVWLLLLLLWLLLLYLINMYVPPATTSLCAIA